MAITEVTGDIFAADTDALVNPVNCVGVMGKGLALQFKERYPQTFRTYKYACDRGQLRPGGILVHRESDEGPFIIHFATKDHWRKPSQIQWINRGLLKLARVLTGVHRERIGSIAIPALGAGLGGLPWEDVRSLVYSNLGYLETDIRLYAPVGGGAR